ncbi:hypothetical protein EV714DRAFT_217309 [Schizophyllum commune]
MGADHCDVCNATGDIKRCSLCRSRFYCSADCQKADWPKHRAACRKNIWYDSPKYRKCDDGSMHEGKLELVTWEGKYRDSDEKLGWGACIVEESEDMKKKYYEEFGGDDKKMFEYWPQGYRWTCCGMAGDMTYGCDHHGTGSKPCTCDYCRAGKPLPDRIYNDPDPHRTGLKLSRGPDPRSYRPGSFVMDMGW